MLMTSFREQYIQLFKNEIKRDGADKLLHYLENSDFFTAPASTRYHLSIEGGLCQHSLNVYSTLCQLSENHMPAVSRESLAVVGMLHDVCKIGCYRETTRNVKKNGRWETVPYYEFDDDLPYGHGKKSVYIISSFMKLNREEAFAIRFHMGFSDEYCDRRNVGKVFEQYPLALLLHAADQFSASILESKSNL